MGILLSQRQEIFCQEVAKGTPVSRAYTNAGYPPSKGNSYRLRLRKRVAARIDELTALRTSAVEPATLTAAEKAGVDQYWVLKSLKRNAVMAMRAGDRAAANRAIELIGKHLGLFIDKKQIEINHIDDADEYLANILELVGQPVLEHEAPQLEQVESGGLNDGSHQHDEHDTTNIIEEIA